MSPVDATESWMIAKTQEARRSFLTNCEGLNTPVNRTVPKKTTAPKPTNPASAESCR
ncbi:protein of unknown function [Candidatus Filomicrobium marinum]|uniref:Uncharacterized protein n=1 Tax=Candidatus Filomicrobium marinum TaxID=1608628 RepID=A0A0D6JFL4_9HYPH|nr:protein of unknown function [Candidatus Filomicrobium marinum]CPR19535.1 protein of unknown function [Candidatus Filomicrobium marinum]